MLPQLGYTKAIVQDSKLEVGAVERPDKETVDIENNPKLKEEYRDFERLANVVEGKDEIEDEDE